MIRKFLNGAGVVRTIAGGAALTWISAGSWGALGATSFPTGLLKTQAVLTNTLEAEYSRFGTAVALDNDRLAIGAAYGENPSIQIFERHDGAWDLRTVLPGPEDEREFGESVALQGGLLVAGSGGIGARIYTLSGTNWLANGMLISGRSGTFDGFAATLAVSGNTILAGAPYDDGRGDAAGAAYIFEPSGQPGLNAWNVTDTSSGDTEGSAPRYRVQPSLAQVAAAASNGWRYTLNARLDRSLPPFSTFFGYGDGSRRFLVYLYLDGNGDLTAQFTGPSVQTFLLTTNGVGAAIYHQHEITFDPDAGLGSYRVDGRSVHTWAGENDDLEGVQWGAGSTKGQGSLNCNRADFVILGSNESVARYDAGTAGSPEQAPSPVTQGWIETEPTGPGHRVSGISPDTSGWEMRGPLTPSSVVAGDGFGSSVAIEGDLLAVGAIGDDEGGNRAGAVYVFQREAGQWSFQAKLLASDAAAGATFGDAVTIESGRIVVGASGATVAEVEHAGAAYVFENDGSGWIERAQLTAREPGIYQFGSSLALEGSTLAIGAKYGPTLHIFVEEPTGWTESGSQAHDDFIDAQVWQAGLHGHTLVVGVANSDLGDGRVKVFEADYGDAEAVRGYVREFLYYPDASTGLVDKSLAAFRYKHLLYADETNQVRARFEQMPDLFGPAERQRAEDARQEVLRALALNPENAVLGDLLLDIYYDGTVAEAILAKSLAPLIERKRLGPPGSAGALVIDEEIQLQEQRTEAQRGVLGEYFKLLQDDLGVSGQPPLGYSIFRQRVPARLFESASYVDPAGEIQNVATNSSPATGYKDLILLFDSLTYQGRGAAQLASLYGGRLGTGDRAMAESLVQEHLQLLTIQGNLLLGIFPNVPLVEGDGSGLAEAIEGWREAIRELARLQQVLAGGGNLLGFSPDFLMLVQKFQGAAGDVFDSYDALQLRLDPNEGSNPLRTAKEWLARARSSFDRYEGYRDQFDAQVEQVTGAAEDRLFQIAGARPGEPAYATPGDNQGSELWQQAQSIELAQLRIQRNTTEIRNLVEQIQIEINRSDALEIATIRHGVQNANLAQEISFRQSAQESLNTIAGASFDNPVSIGANYFAGFFGFFGTGKKVAELEGDKEMLAADQQAEILGIERAAEVKTMWLGMRTLQIDSQEAALLLNQEWGRYAALLREKADLERTLAESQGSLRARYFADPIHRLRFRHDTVMANLTFHEAQKWLSFMVRALEYKWNAPFTNFPYLDRRWSAQTLSALRNAEELELFYGAMEAYDDQIQLPTDDYFDWFSVREDFFGFTASDSAGNALQYVDVDTGETVDALEAFRRRLRALMDAQGNVRLPFSTVREIPGGSFFLGPRFTAAGQIISKGLYLDKIRWLQINLPGRHTQGRTQLTGQLTYGGASFLRNQDVGTFVPDQPDRLRDELTAYSTRFWFFHPASNSWRFTEALMSPVTMQLSADSRVPPTIQQIEVFKERSVAASGWELLIPTIDAGRVVLDIDQLDDVELYFYHYAVTRP